MECNRAQHHLGPGQLLALNPGDAHGCVQEGAVPLVYDSLALLDPRLPALRRPHRGRRRSRRFHGRHHRAA